jgi:hypothetical protein
VPCDTTAALSLGARAAYRVAVRAQGLVDEVPGAGPADHLCWVYEDDAAFDEAAREFLVGGLARGDRLLCVGQRVIDSLQALTPPILDAAALIAGGAVETLTLAERTRPPGPSSPNSSWPTTTRRHGVRWTTATADCG